MGAVVVATRYVPRPPEDTLWTFWRQQDNGIAPLLLPQGGNFPFHNNRSVLLSYDDATPWTFWKQQDNGIAPILLPSGQAPFSNCRWSANLDDSAVTSQNQSIFSELRLPVGGGFPFKPPYWQYNNDESNVWVQNQSIFSEIRLPVGGGFPFKPSFFQSNYDDQGVWQNKSFGPSLVLELASNLPVAKPPYWPFNNDDAPVWNAKSIPVNRVIDLAFVKPLTPKQWVFDVDQPREWVGQSLPAFNLLSQPLQLYFAAPAKYVSPGSDETAWQARQAANYLLLSAVVANPFTPTRWKYDNDDNAPVWQKKPVGPSLLLELAGNLPFIPPYWRYNNDDAAVWRGFPANVSIVQQLIISPPLLPQRWRFNNDDPPFWNGAPGNVSVNITQPGAPVVPPADDGTRGSETILTDRRGAGGYSRKQYDEFIRAKRAAQARLRKLKKKPAEELREAIEVATRAAGLIGDYSPSLQPVTDALRAAAEADATQALQAAVDAFNAAQLLLAQLEDDDEDDMMIILSSL